jgi:hypothetical protein
MGLVKKALDMGVLLAEVIKSFVLEIVHIYEAYLSNWK